MEIGQEVKFLSVIGIERKGTVKWIDEERALIEYEARAVEYVPLSRIGTVCSLSPVAWRLALCWDWWWGCDQPLIRH